MFDKALIDELTAKAVFGPKTKAAGSAGVAVSSHPLVSHVAVETLRAGGNAVDAVLAAAVAQTVAEPHMTTIFGMLSMMHYDAGSQQVRYLNGAMNAPLSGLPGFNAADLGNGRSAAVPGFWAAWEAARAQLGSKPREELIAPAVSLARLGVPVYPFLYGMLFEQAHRVGLTPEGREIYFPRGGLINPGERLHQHRLGDTLEALAAGGHDHFYRSNLTQRFVDAIAAAGGVLTREDFDRYEVRWVDPAWGSYRGHTIAGSPPPDTGGTHLIEILQILEQLPLREWGPPTQSAETLYWLARACNEVFTEGARYRDPRSWPVPLETIVSKEYAQQRLSFMRMSDPQPPQPGAYPGSNHLTVVDAAGNIATVLHSVMALPWSNGLIVDGVAIWAGASHFFRQMPRPGDRGTCYVAPHIIFDADKRPLLAGGSPGVGLIPACVQNALNIMDFGLDIETSVHRPRVGGPSLASMLTPGAISHMVEVDCGSPAVHDAVRARGLAIEPVSPWHFHLGSYDGVHLLAGGSAEACADPRRAGAAMAV